MKTIMMFALTALISTAAQAQMLPKHYVDIPADEAAMARTSTNLRDIDSPKIACAQLIRKGAERWDRENRERRVHHESTPELRTYVERKCGGMMDFHAKMVREANEIRESREANARLSRSVTRASTPSTRLGSSHQKSGFEAIMQSIGLGAFTGGRLPEAIRPPKGGWPADRTPARSGSSNR